MSLRSALVALLCGTLLLLLANDASIGAATLSGPPIRIGVFECSLPAERACFIPRIEVLHALFFDRVAQTGILGRPVQKVVTWISGTNVAKSDEMAAATQGLLDQGVDAVIWPMANTRGAAGMALLEAAQIPSIAGGIIDSSLFRCDERSWCDVGCECPAGAPPIGSARRRRFQYVHSPTNVDESYLREWVALMRLKKASRLAAISTGSSAIARALDQLARDYRLEQVYSAVAPYISSSQAVVSLDTALNYTRYVMSLAPDGLALLVNDCGPWLAAMRQLDYMPPSLVTLNCIDNSAATGQSLMERNFVSGIAQWDARLSSSEYTEKLGDPWALFGVKRVGLEQLESGLVEDQDWNMTTTSASLFVRAVQQAYNSSIVPGYTYGALLASGEMLHAAMILANSSDGPLVNEQLKRLSITTFYGLIETNSFGYNQHKPMLILQQDLKGKVQIVAPIQYATADFVYPTPGWNERAYKQRLMHLPVVRVFLALVVVCAAVTLVLVLFVLLRWDHPLFRATGPLSYVAVGVGCLTGYAAVLCWSVENNAAQCAARVWLVSIAFHCVMQPLLFATHNVHRIHSASRSLRTPSIQKPFARDRVRLLRVLAILPPLVFNLAFGVPVLEPRYEAGEDVLRPALSAYTQCTPRDSGTFVVFLALHCVYGGLLLLLTCVYAVRIRRLPRVFHDASSLAYSVYVFGLSMLYVIVTQAVLADGGAQRSMAVLSFALRSAGILLGYLSCVVLLIGSRIQLPRRIKAQTFLSSTVPPTNEHGRHGEQQQQQQNAQGHGGNFKHWMQNGGGGVAGLEASPPAADGLLRVGPGFAAAAAAPGPPHLTGPIPMRFLFPDAFASQQPSLAAVGTPLGDADADADGYDVWGDKESMPFVDSPLPPELPLMHVGTALPVVELPPAAKVTPSHNAAAGHATAVRLHFESPQPLLQQSLPLPPLPPRQQASEAPSLFQRRENAPALDMRGNEEDDTLSDLASAGAALDEPAVVRALVSVSSYLWDPPPTRAPSPPLSQESSE